MVDDETVVRRVDLFLGIAVGEVHVGNAQPLGQHLHLAVAVGDADRADVIALGEEQLQNHAAVQVASDEELADAWVRLAGDPVERAFTVFHLADGIPVAVTTVNTARDMRFARMIVQRGRPVDPAALANKAVKLQDLAR